MTVPTPKPAPPQRSPVARFFRRAAAVLLIGLIVYGLLWAAVFNAVTAALVATGGTVVLVAGASVSETVQSIFETLAERLLGLLGAIAGFFSSLFD